MAYSEERKRAVSEGMARRRAELRARGLDGVPPEGWKRCPRCGEMKYYNVKDTRVSEYSRSKRKYKNGEEAWIPVAWCKRCIADQAAERRAKMTAEELVAQRRYYWSIRDKKKVRERQRHYDRSRRRAEGKPRRPRGKYRGEFDDLWSSTWVQPQLFLDLWYRIRASLGDGERERLQPEEDRFVAAVRTAHRYGKVRRGWIVFLCTEVLARPDLEKQLLEESEELEPRRGYS